jgi:hypothetical protein
LERAVLSKLSISRIVRNAARYSIVLTTGLRLAYRFGVTTGITAPRFLAGLSTVFNTGLPYRAANGAVVQDIAALDVSIDSSSPSVSTQITALRNLLQGGGKGELAARFEIS